MRSKYNFGLFGLLLLIGVIFAKQTVFAAGPVFRCSDGSGLTGNASDSSASIAIYCESRSQVVRGPGAGSHDFNITCGSGLVQRVVNSELSFPPPGGDAFPAKLLTCAPSGENPPLSSYRLPTSYTLPDGTVDTPTPPRPPAGGGGGGGGGGNTISDPSRAANINCDDAAACFQQNSLVKIVKRAIRFFGIIIGVIVTIVIVWAGFTYARAGGDPSTTAEAKNRIKNAIIALAFFIFIGAMLNWAIPGSLSP